MALSAVSVDPPLSLIISLDTLVQWHRAVFRRYWQWKSRGRIGRHKVGHELRALFQRMSAENSLWGALRIHSAEDFRSADIPRSIESIPCSVREISLFTRVGNSIKKSRKMGTIHLPSMLNSGQFGENSLYFPCLSGNLA